MRVERVTKMLRGKETVPVEFGLINMEAGIWTMHACSVPTQAHTAAHQITGSLSYCLRVT